MITQAIYLKNVLVPHAREVIDVPAGRTIRDLAPTWETPFVAFIDGDPVLRADWELVIENGRSVAFIDVNAIPQGGGGGSNPLRIVAMLAVAIYAPQLMSSVIGIEGAAVLGSTGVALANAAAVGVGMMLVNAVLPPPKPPSPQMAADLAAPSPTYSLQAQGNSARIGAAIPEHFGRMLAYPDFAAMPYAEFAGNEQYLYELLCIGRGYYDIEAIRIEDSPISGFDEISYEVIQPGGSITLFPSNVITSVEVSGQELTDDGAWVGGFIANPSGTVANTIGLDFVAARGLYYANDDGSLSAKTVSWSAEYQTVDYAGNPTSAWTALASDSFTATTTTPQRWSVRCTPPTAGRFKVRVKRTNAKDTSTRAGHELAWAGMRAYLPETRTFGDVTLLAMRMRASNNLSQQGSRKINVICTRKLPIWNGSTWSAPTATRSIAWAFAYACKQVGVTDSQMDLATLMSLNTTWSGRSDTFDGRFDNFLSFWEALSKIAQAGRAKPFVQGGIVRIMRDQAASVPVALYSQRNIIKNSLSVDYLMPTDNTADAVDVSYFDQNMWAPATVQSKLSGSAANMPAKIDLFGVVSRDQAFREGIYQAACNRYRRKLIKFSTEMEGFIPSYGDLIAVQHDMPAWGQGGEVVGWNAGTKTATLSEPVTFSAGTHYIALRKRDGSVDGPYTVTAGANAYQVVLATSPSFTPYTGQGEERTHFSFGWSETWRQPAKVIAVRPRGLFQVEVEAINEDPSVHTAEVGQTAPAITTSQLGSTVTAPTVVGVTAYIMPFQPNKLVVSWQPAPSADSYVIELSSDGDTWTSAGTATSTSMTTVALYGADTQVRVAGIGLTRGPWAYVTVAAVPPTEDVSSFTASTQYDRIVLSWTGNPAADFDHYEIRYGASWAAGTVVAQQIKATAVKLIPDFVGSRRYMIKAINTSKVESVTEAVANITLSVPSTPSLSASQYNSVLSLSWSSSVTSFPIDHYEIWYGLTSADNFFKNVTYAHDQLAITWTTNYKMGVRAVDLLGNVSPMSNLVDTVGAAAGSAPDLPPSTGGGGSGTSTYNYEFLEAYWVGTVASQTGQTRKYMLADATIFRITAWSSGTVWGGNTTITLKKNGTAIGSVTIYLGNAWADSGQINLGVTSGDYLTLDIATSGAYEVGVSISYMWTDHPTSADRGSPNASISAPVLTLQPLTISTPGHTP